MMPRFFLRRVAQGAALLVALAVGAAQGAAQDTLTFTGADGRTSRYTARQLQSMAGDTVRLTLHHQAPGTYSVVPVRRLLGDAGINVDSLRGRQLTLAVVAEARDGYRVAIALGELAPGLGGRSAVIAFRRDHAALSREEGPFRLIILGDERAARSVRQLVSLRVVDAASIR